MRMLVLISILGMGITLSVFAQDKAIGLRMGESHGFYFDIESKGLTTNRFLLSNRAHGQQITFIQYHRMFKLKELPSDFSFYYGFGAHGGYTRWDGREVVTRWGDTYRQHYIAPVIGLDGLIGVSYHFSGLPLLVSAEAKPYFDFWGRNIFRVNPFDVGFAVSYIF